LILVFVRRYRRRGPNEITPHITHNQTLEVVWSVVPLVILIGISSGAFTGT
jgi:cytochrome c oxidase subunit 2